MRTGAESLASKNALSARRVGRLTYSDALGLQTETAELRIAEQVPNTLLLLEHDPVYTRGRRAVESELPMGAEWYLRQGIEVAETDRGGQVTYHGPGQLVAYPIIDLSGRDDDVHRYVRDLEQTMVSSLGRMGVEAGTVTGLTGVWTGETGLLGDSSERPEVQDAVVEGALRKIGSIGVHVSRSVTTHGFSLNVECDLQPFQWIVPCGIEGCKATSVLVETGESPGMDAAFSIVEEEFARIFAPGARD